MGNKQMLFDLIKKYRDIILNSHEYVLCNRVLSKISASMLACNSDKIEIDLNEISKLSEEEMTVFTSSECFRIVMSLGTLSSKKGWRVDTVLKLIKYLQQDILENKMNKFTKNQDSLNELYRIVEQELFLDNYKTVLDFIKTSVDNDLLSIKDGINLNFYILNVCSINKDIKNEQEIEIVELQENTLDEDVVKNKLIEIFDKYGYRYDSNRMREYDRKFVKYADISYIAYVLEKFKRYDVDERTLYLRKKALYNIVIDNDKKAFDSILDFINDNNCTLSKLLSMPSIFSKRKKNYVECIVNNRDDINASGNIVVEVCGSQQDFLENIKLYKDFSQVELVNDVQLDGLFRFLCTPSSLVKKNLDLLRRYGIIGKNNLPKSILSLCGNSTEYLIDRYIELGIYDDYLLPRYNNSGELKEGRGTCYLDKDNNPFKFYKIKRARDIGQNVFATNVGIRKVFRDDNESYVGISLDVDSLGNKQIVQEPLTLEFMGSLTPGYRRQLPDYIKNKINTGEISENDIDLIYFDNLYRYKVVSPIEIFEYSAGNSLASLKGERVNSVFSKDYRRVLSDDEIKNLELDSFIAMLDNAVYCDSYGNSSRIKVDDLRYEFSHPSVQNVVVNISRYKVLRLCKLLKEDGSWLNNSSSNIDKENTILSILLKDTIVSEIELLVLRLSVKDILANGLIRVSQINESGRGAR